MNKKIEEIMNQCDSIQNLEKIDYRTLCSWLLILSPTELVILAAILGVLISKKLTPDENNIVGQFLSTVGGNMQLAASQELFIQKAIEEKQKMVQQKMFQQKSNNPEKKSSDNKETGKQS